MQYSILIPVHNEEENLSSLVQEICCVMHNLEGSFEIIIIDDGSTDSTVDTISKIFHQIPQLRLIRLACKCGQSAALSTGLQEAKGQLIITLDGDGQNNPEDIPTLIKALHGYDCVTGYRMNRKDPWIKRLSSKCANAMRRFVLKDPIKDAGCALKICTASSIRMLPQFTGMHRLLPSLFIIYGFSVVQIPVHHRPRVGGISKYSLFNRIWGPFCDLLGLFWLKKRHITTHVIQRMPP